MRKKVIIFFMFLFSACSVGQKYDDTDYISQESVKETLLLSNETSNITNDWFKIFDDDYLNTLINHALNSNFSIKQGIERLRQARYQYLIYSKQFYPMLSNNLGYSFSKSNSNKNLTSDINAFKLNFDFSWEIDVWGKGENINEQYNQIIENSQLSILNIKTMIVAEVISVYTDLALSQKLLDIANKNLALQQDILKSVKDKYSTGTEAYLALNQAEAVIDKTKQLIPQYKTQIEKNTNSLAILLGVLPNKLPSRKQSNNLKIVSNTFKYSVNNLYNLPLDIIHSRPDVLSAKTSIKEQNAVVNQAITDLYPSINLDMAFGFISSSGTNLFNNKSQVYSISPLANIPIWNWGQLKNNVELQKSIKEEYILKYNETVLNALLELKTAITSVEQAYKANDFAASSLRKMENILMLTQNKFDNGLVEFTDLAKAELDYLDAQNVFIETNASIIKNITAFYKATGGGYNIRLKSKCF